MEGMKERIRMKWEVAKAINSLNDILHLQKFSHDYDDSWFVSYKLMKMQDSEDLE